MNDFESDYYRFTGISNDGFFSKLKNIVFRHNLRFLYWLRTAEKDKLLGKIMCCCYSRKFGLEISPDAKIGKGLYLGHPYNITVGSNCIIGENVNLHKGCTIGSTSGKNWGSPVIGHCVWIGINATVVGKITIGDDVLIAPGAYVNFDVPSHSVVIGNPGEIHYKKNATEYYINNKTML